MLEEPGDPAGIPGGPLAGGHLQAVLHATRSSELPEDDLAAIREYTRAPVVLLASGEASLLLDAALEAFAERPSVALTVIAVPAGVDGPKWEKLLETKYGLKVAGGAGTE